MTAELYPHSTKELMGGKRGREEQTSADKENEWHYCASIYLYQLVSGVFNQYF